MDGDGWIDFVCSGVWYRNTGKPREQPFERYIFDENAAGAHDIVIADMNRDGDMDICSKPWGPRAWNGNGGKMHVDFLENLHKP